MSFCGHFPSPPSPLLLLIQSPFLTWAVWRSKSLRNSLTPATSHASPLGFCPGWLLQGSPEVVWSCRGGCGWAAPAWHRGQQGSSVLRPPGQHRPCACPGRGQFISLLITALLRPDLLLLALRNLCHLYSVPSLNLQYTFCFSSHQPLSPPSTLMQDTCGIHLGIYLKTISHPGFNTFPHQGGAKLDLNENRGIVGCHPSQHPMWSCCTGTFGITTARPTGSHSH